MWNAHHARIIDANHHIVLTFLVAPTVQSTPYRAGLKQQNRKFEENENTLEAAVAQFAVTEWASGEVLVPEKEGRLRFCGDYLRLNAVTEPDSYPILRMGACIDLLGKAKMLSTIDANSRY